VLRHVAMNTPRNSLPMQNVSKGSMQGQKQVDRVKSSLRIATCDEEMVSSHHLMPTLSPISRK